MIETLGTFNFKLHEIRPSGFNLRTSFEDDSLQELCDSIKQVGLLQPIIVRYNPDDTGCTYEIVCGHRRFRACMMANLEELPCVLMSLTDGQAMEVNITENLQRSDIHPLEEAAAFYHLVQGLHTVASLALRFGKSESFIRGRIKLNDLRDPFKKLLLADKINLYLALEVAKYPVDTQDLFWKSMFSDALEYEYWNPPSARRLRDYVKNNILSNLSDVNFEISDASLVPEAGSCLICPNNTSNDLVLFPEPQNGGKCLDPVCISNKKQIHLFNQVKEVMANEPDTPIGIDGYVSYHDENDIARLKEIEVPFYEFSYDNGYKRLSPPDEPDMPTPEDFDAGNEDEEFIDELAQYNRDYDMYLKELASFETAKTAEGVKRVFMVSGRDKGKYAYFIPHGKKPVSEMGETAQGSSKDRIKALEAKHERNEEIVFEKIFNVIRDMLHKSTYGNLFHPVTTNENDAFFQIIAGYNSEVKVPDFEILNRDLITIPTKPGLKLFRRWILDELYSAQPTVKNRKAKLLILIATENFKDECNKLTEPIQSAYTKKRNNIQKAIDEIKAETKKGKVKA